MMIQNLFRSSGDFEKTLRLRRGIALGLLMVGVVALVSYFGLVKQSTLPDFAQGFYLGAGAGVLLGGFLLLVRTQYLLAHPEACKKAQIKEEDEREQTITDRASKFAGLFTFFAAAAALFVVLPFNMGAFFALMGVMLVYFLVFYIASVVYSRLL
jgi:hypothetical protein